MKSFSVVIEPEDNDDYLESNVYVVGAGHAKVVSHSSDSGYITSIDIFPDKDNDGNAAINDIVLNFYNEDKTCITITGAKEFEEFIHLIGFYALSQGYLDKYTSEEVKRN